MNPTDPTPLPCPTPRTDAQAAKNLEQFPEGFTTFKPDAHVDAEFARQLETQLAQAQAELEKLREMKRPWISAYEAIEGMWRAQAEAAAMREWVRESVVVSMEFADGRVITKADLLATTAGAELLERLRKAEDLAKHFLPTTTENTKPQ